MRTQINFYQGFDRDAVSADSSGGHAWLRIEQMPGAAAGTEVVFHFKDRDAVVALADRLNSIASEMVDQAERAQLTSEANSEPFLPGPGPHVIEGGKPRMTLAEEPAPVAHDPVGYVMGAVFDQARTRTHAELMDIAHNPDIRD